jgi:LL-diaminopimelate aminotransferase
MGSYIQELFAERIGGKMFGKDDRIYKFEKIKRAKRAALKENPGTLLVDLGVGEPDEKAFDQVIKTLQEEAVKSENRGYADNGTIEFNEAASQYMKDVFNVNSLDPEKEIVHAIGSKSALSMLPSAFINPGDVTLMTVPGYPVLGTHSSWYGGEVYNIPLKKENGFLPDYNEIPADKLEKAKILLINYPNNPTGANATEDFYRKTVEFAKKNNLIVIQDAAYAALIYNKKPLSFLSIPGAREVGIEIHSLSKAFNMTGWRIAFVAGNPLIVNAFASVKDNYDSGQFLAIQKAAITALKNPDITRKISEKYERRLKAIVGILKDSGFDVKMPDGTFYLYVEIPKGIKGGQSFSSGEDFSQFLIKEKLISTVPWDDVGNFIRFSATFETTENQDEDEIIKEIGNRLKSLDFEFIE